MNTQETVIALKNAFTSACQLALKLDVLEAHITIGIDSEESKNSLLHLIAKEGYLKYTPKELVTFKNLMAENSDGATVFDLAWEAKPSQLLGVKLPKTYRSRVGNEWWTINEMFLTCVTEHFESNLPHSDILRCAANHGFLFAVRDEFLMKELFLETHPKKDTALQTAAIANHMDQVPKEFLTEKNLMRKHRSRTTLSLAYEHGTLDQLLGLKLSERCKPIVGNKWWVKNQIFLAAKPSLVIATATEPDIELF